MTGLTVGSLFSGIGGLDLGFERAGFEIIWQCERDPFCREVLAKHWPGIPCLEDVHDVSVGSVPGVDVLIGGFPCQPVSCAGKRRGHDDERWLWPEMFRIVRELRPGWICAENVLGLRTLGADRVIEDLESEGYAVWPLVVGADDVGAPHRRKRVFIVAHRDGFRRTSHGSGASTKSDSDQPKDGVPRPDGSVAHRDGGRRELVGQPEPRGLERPSGHEPDGCRETGSSRPAPLGHSDDSRLEGRGLSGRERPDERAAWETGNSRWPARPGERQHDWEAPRLAYAGGIDGQRGGAWAGGRVGSECDAQGDRPPADGYGPVESGMGDATDGLSGRLAGFTRRNALKALGNAVVPQVAEVIARAIRSAVPIPAQTELFG